MLAGLAVVVALAIAVSIVLRGAAEREALRDAERLARISGRDIVAPAITPAVLRGDPGALATLDEVVQQRVLDDTVVRVKVWRPDGRIVYDDGLRQVGERFPLAPDDRAALRDPARVDAETSDLSRPENRVERRYGRLIEVYTAIPGPAGPLLYEEYFRPDAITGIEDDHWHAFLPPLVAALFILWLLQAPLAWHLARKIAAGRAEQEHLLRQAIASSDQERRRIAADLHDGVVQDLAGLSFALQAAADRPGGETPDRVVRTLRDGAVASRVGVRRLRSLLVEIHPPNLHSQGLEAALADLVSRLQARGITPQIRLNGAPELSESSEAMVFRVAQEALRNVSEHSEATHVEVTLQDAGGGMVELRVVDDGRGFTPDDRRRRREEGHLGLELLEGLVASGGGRLEVLGAPGAGTSVILTYPAGAVSS
ncbi:MAG: histidine kinase [Thermoleophilia bacterium]|jgi:signal transduction histidine kinase|nr:histidine kinase [Thermoleophilia bacterium]